MGTGGKKKVKGHTLGLMEISMRESGRMIKNMEKESFII